ncbi:unnamed protein product [Amoebophrya sp. A120]|nr:unnamed protein product [Amoebophrya sp. A120]|eukprot:GSA120T00011117001.1
MSCLGGHKQGELMYMTQYDLARIPELAEIVFIPSIAMSGGKPQLRTDPDLMDSRLHAYFPDRSAYRTGLERANEILRENWGADGYWHRLSPKGTELMRDCCRSMSKRGKTELQFWLDYNQDMCRFDVFACSVEPAFRLCVVVPMEFNPKSTPDALAAGEGRGVYKTLLEELPYRTDKDVRETATVELKDQEVELVLRPDFAVRGYDCGDGWLEVPGDLRNLYLPLSELQEMKDLSGLAEPGQKSM